MAIFTQDRFSFDHNGIHFEDAIVLPKDEYDKLTPEEIESMKLERFTSWQNIISAPVETKEATPEELAKQVQSIDEQITVLTAQKEELSAKAVMLGEMVSVKEVIKGR